MKRQERQAEAAQALRGAEAAIQQLVAAAMSERDYISSRLLAETAEGLHGLATALEAGLGPVNAEGQSEGKDGNERGRITPPRTPNRKSGRGRAEYLRRDDEWLVRRAWSKQAKDYYSHKAPVDMLASLLEACIAVGGKRSGFSVEGLLEADCLKGLDTTQAQVYLGVGWFKELGLIVPGTRRGRYVLADRSKQVDPAVLIGGELKKLKEESRV